mgnify:CR=1 FL=1
MNNLIKVALRYQAIYLPRKVAEIGKDQRDISLYSLVGALESLGYAVPESLWKALQEVPSDYRLQLEEVIFEQKGRGKNWTPLVRGWQLVDTDFWNQRFVPFFANVFGWGGETLPCGHHIPSKLFPIEEYTGCPVCNTPFAYYEGWATQSKPSKRKRLEFWTEKEMDALLERLLTSTTPLDATQLDSLKLLLTERPLPSIKVGMKETLVAVIDLLSEMNRAQWAYALFQRPNEILRYLWYRHTGTPFVLKPKTILDRSVRNQRHLIQNAKVMEKEKAKVKQQLKLKFTRAEGRQVAFWLSQLPLEVEAMAADMHTKRNMWVRFIRALRLVEFSRKPGYEKLKAALDCFHDEDFVVWQGRVDAYRLRMESGKTLALLKQRPGTFARSLFANMLWFGPGETLGAFRSVLDKVPARLIFSLANHAPAYFSPNGFRAVKPLGGNPKMVAKHPGLQLYSREALAQMVSDIEQLVLETTWNRFEGVCSEATTMFIDPALYQMPLPVGDRSLQVQDASSAIPGTRFKVQGKKVRLFMQWGTGLKAQHLDMDLSCAVIYRGKTDHCSYSKLKATGCMHSGDIINIPNKVGTAEYIELDLPVLKKAGAQYVVFTCNAYSRGVLSPNMVVGWMDSRYPMKVSPNTGVAYDPAMVQHQVRISEGLSKGLVFGVLEVAQREIVWLETPFQGQVVGQLNLNLVLGLLHQLHSKISIGEVLEVKGQAQEMTLTSKAKAAEEVYDVGWARDASKVTELLMGDLASS